MPRRTLPAWNRGKQGEMGWPTGATVLDFRSCLRIPRRLPSRRQILPALDPPPARPRRVVHRVRQNVARGLRRGAVLGAAGHRRPAPLDDRGGIQRNLRAVPFPARSEHRQPVGGVRVALSRNCRRRRGLCRAGRAADGHRDHSGGAYARLARSMSCGGSWPGCPAPPWGCCSRSFSG